MENYKPNSHKYKEEQRRKQKQLEKKKVEKVISGKAKVKKKSEAAKLTEKIISTEDVGNLKSYLLEDVIIPTIRNTIWDAITNSLDMLLFGGTGRSRRKSLSNKVSYRDYYDKDRRSGSRVSERKRTGYSFDDIILESRGEAEEVLERMDELIDTYSFASVADLYDLVGITCEYTDNKYGWTNIRNAEPIRVRDGYMLKMPKALPID